MNIYRIRYSEELGIEVVKEDVVEENETSFIVNEYGMNNEVVTQTHYLKVYNDVLYTTNANNIKEMTKSYVEYLAELENSKIRHAERRREQLKERLAIFLEK